MRSVRPRRQIRAPPAGSLNFTRGEDRSACLRRVTSRPQVPSCARRTERIHRFEELDDVVSVLDKLAQREPALVASLPRQPGSREIRYAHLLSGAPDTAQFLAATAESAGSVTRSSDHERLCNLKAEVATLRQEVADLKAQLAALISSS